MEVLISLAITASPAVNRSLVLDAWERKDLVRFVSSLLPPVQTNQCPDSLLSKFKQASLQYPKLHPFLRHRTIESHLEQFPLHPHLRRIFAINSADRCNKPFARRICAFRSPKYRAQCAQQNEWRLQLGVCKKQNGASSLRLLPFSQVASARTLAEGNIDWQFALCMQALKSSRHPAT